MAYQTGVSSTMADLISAVVAFAVANGWSAGSTWSYSGGTVVSLTRSGAEYVTIYYTTTALSLNTASALVSGQALTSQTGACPYNALVSPISPPHAGYHLFTDGMAVHCVVEIVSGVFMHFNFGLMTKNGTWAGGTFVCGTYTDPNTSGGGASYRQLPNAYSHPPFAGNGTTTSISLSNTTVTSQHFRSNLGGTGRVARLCMAGTTNSDVGLCSPWMSDITVSMLSGPNAANGRSVIFPVIFYQASTGVTGPFYQMGSVPNAGICNIANLDPKSIVNTDWMVFPVGQKNGNAVTYINSQGYAMAYKK